MNETNTQKVSGSCTFILEPRLSLQPPPRESKPLSEEVLKILIKANERE